jgi:phosphopantothenoylcysteine decarboxylase/phosphopantothenate--cysteine ligase
VTTAERRLAGRLVAVGVTGSIAAYKAADLVRRLRDEGADVVVLMTPTATRFVGELTFAALTRHPVETDVGGLLPDQRIGHIVIADSADAIVVAPATAHWLASMAAGLAGDPVTATCLATAAPVVVAPAMDGEMYGHPATRANVARLRDGFGYRIVEPEAGPLASGQTGQGRLAETAAIVEAVVAALDGRPVRAPDAADRPPLVGGEAHDADLEGRHVVITAGGTAEPIDPVRFIGNRSTGKMGMALAQAAVDRGARVTLIVGHISVGLPTSADVLVFAAETTAEMGGLVRSAMAEADALIMAAAVADFRPRETAATKLGRVTGLTLELEPTEDILAGVAEAVPPLGDPTRPILVGFAAETGSLDRAADKLQRKGVDLLVANDVAEEGSGFGTDTNHVWILSADGDQVDLPIRSKRAVAEEILDRVAAALDARDAAAQTDPVTQETRA